MPKKFFKKHKTDLFFVCVFIVALVATEVWAVNRAAYYPKPPSCAYNTQVYERVELIFGDIPKNDWDKFLSAYVDPYFPGYNIKVSQGRWKGESEGSFEIQLIYQNDATVMEKVQLIRKKYKELFNQESVLLEVFQVCAEF